MRFRISWLAFTIIFFLSISTEIICQAGKWQDDFNHASLHGWTLLSEGLKGEWMTTWQIQNDQLDVTVHFPPGSPRGNSFVSSFLQLTAFPIPVEDFTMSLRIVFEDRLRGDIGLALGKRLPPDDRFFGDVIAVLGFQVISRGFNENGRIRAGNWFGGYKLSRKLTVSSKKNGRFIVRTENAVMEFKNPQFKKIDLIGIIVFGRKGFQAVVDDFEISGKGIPDGNATDLAVTPRGKLEQTWGRIKSQRL